MAMLTGMRSAGSFPPKNNLRNQTHPGATTPNMGMAASCFLEVVHVQYFRCNQSDAAPPRAAGLSLGQCPVEPGLLPG